MFIILAQGCTKKLECLSLESFFRSSSMAISEAEAYPSGAFVGTHPLLANVRIGSSAKRL